MKILENRNVLDYPASMKRSTRCYTSMAKDLHYGIDPVDLYFFAIKNATELYQDAALIQGVIITIVMLEPILEPILDQILCCFILTWLMPLLPLRGC